jgi:hypothetical protein
MGPQAAAPSAPAPEASPEIEEATPSSDGKDKAAPAKSSKPKR